MEQEAQETNKIAYFTVDDSPSKDMKEKVDFLISKKISSIWFCRGEFMEANFDALVYAINQGVILGNHSFTHPLFSKLSLEACKEEVLKTEVLINKVNNSFFASCSL